jgi:hypothetical protein
VVLLPAESLAVPAAVVHPTARSSAPSFAKTGAVVAVAVGCACIETAGQYMLKSLVPCSLLLPRESQRVEAFIRVDIRHLNAIAEFGPISRHWQVGRATFID